MNIFALDRNPELCAKYHCNKHIVKQILETSQLLCTALLHTKSVESAPYKITHLNHPASIWCRKSSKNYEWLCELGLELCKEYTRRYNKRHKCQDVIEWAKQKKICGVDVEMTSFVLCMPDKYKVGDPVDSYRNYYKGAKSHIAQWKGEVPYWYGEK